MRTQCPYCGGHYHILESPLEQELMAFIEQYAAQSGKATTEAVATQFQLSRAQTWRYLKRLEAMGHIQRIGMKGGWKRV